MLIYFPHKETHFRKFRRYNHLLTAQTNGLHLFSLASFCNFSITVYYLRLLWMSILPFMNCLQLISMIDCEDLNGMGSGSLPKNTDSLNDYLASFMVTLSGCLRKIKRKHRSLQNEYDASKMVPLKLLEFS